MQTEKCEGGDPFKADQLLPEMEKEVFQAQREDALLCQRLQGKSISTLSVVFCSGKKTLLKL